MDRNYFLSYSHRVALLLLLSAVGKLNAKFISVTISKAEWQYCTDRNNNLPSHFADVSTSQSLKANPLAMEGVAHHEDTDRLYQRALKNNFPATGKGLFSSFLKGKSFVATWFKWTSLDSDYYKDPLTLFERVKKFCINPSKLVDGFKFIIKIPDKFIGTLVK